MCGIVGYVGSKKVEEVLLKGLKNLEYRGYDSSGIALKNKKEVQVIKSVGKIKDLEEKLKNERLIEGNMGIAHTRWATHGFPNVVNAHPHQVGKITLVHNGIIENANELKEKLIGKGYSFVSQTDTEVVAALIDYYYHGNMIEAILKMQKEVIGSYALVLFSNDQDCLYATRKESPLIVGISDNEYFLASDIGAVSSFTQQYFDLEENDIVVLSEQKYQVYQKGKWKKKIFLKQNINRENDYSKLNYQHYMLKEIMEEPDLLEQLIKELASSCCDLQKNLPSLCSYDEIHIVACGSALYAGMIGKNLLEEKAQIPTRVEVASEYRYQNISYRGKVLVIVISQSGETADTIAALRKAKKNHLDTLGIINVETSTIAKEVDQAIFIHAGNEIAVATTKAYLLQVAVLSLLALKNCVEAKKINEEECLKTLNCFYKAPQLLREIVKRDYRFVAQVIAKHENLFFIGRRMDYAMCLEGSLKLKEVSYLHSEAYQAGELKHGTISLISPLFPVIAIITEEKLKDKTISNLKETEARGAQCIVITTEQLRDTKEEYLTIVVDTLDLFTQAFLIIPVLQLLAYETAKLRHCDIDQPKNLAKSVTVE